MKKRMLALLLTGGIVAAVCGAAVIGHELAGQNAAVEESTETENTEEPAQEETLVSDNTEAPSKEEVPEADTEDEEEPSGPVKAALIGEEEIYYNENLTPCVAPYTIAEDFSNVVYADRFANWFDPSYDSADYSTAPLRNALIKNGFAVGGNYGNSEFFDVYEDNRYVQFPSFITVDSLMHTYHLYFAHLMKQTEIDYLSPTLIELSQKLLKTSTKQYKELAGTEWEDAAKKNMTFFYVGSKLLDETTKFTDADPQMIADAEDEISKIMEASGGGLCAITNLAEDYTQYKPRGYYEKTELEPYFRAMMWYGRTPFTFDDEDLTKSAILMTCALNKSGLRKWESIYNITSFFAGASDDPGYKEMAPILESAYGQMPTLEDLVSNKDAFSKVAGTAGEAADPKINSIPVMDGENPKIASFRFMGQRFTLDAAIMQRLVHSAVQDRYLPDTLDALAAFGSDTAMEILEEQGDTAYPGYLDNMEEVKELYGNAPSSDWNASLYASWLNTLRPLLKEKGEGYPSYMQSKEWVKKDMETFAGSYAELKHDTILYAKQVMAEMGGGEDEEVLDDRGYVDPEPVIYSRFVFLSDKTREGLEYYGMLDEDAKEDLERLSVIAKTLLTISEKELVNEALTDEEYDFIRCYGGDLEHFWREANKDQEESLGYSYQAPCPVIADIATDPNGTVLEVGTGNAQNMFVVFPIDGELHVGRGSVYSFYQFEQPIDNRLTDSEWRGMVSGGYLDDDWNWVEAAEMPAQPAWTQSYRYND